MTDRKLMIENAIEDINRKATDRQMEAGRLYLGALQGDQKAKHALIEGISTSDIPALLAPAINVQFLANYAAQPVVWDQIAETVIDAPRFGNVEFAGFDFDVDSLKSVTANGDQYVGAGLPAVGELAEYPALSFTTEQLNVDLQKNGVRLRISWEAILNSGNVDIIGRATEAFARYAAEQEDIALAKQFVGTTGTINSSFVVANNGAPNPALTLASLEKALAQASRINVGTGRHVNARSYRLVTTSALAQTASQILSTTEVRRTQGSDLLIQSPALGNVNYTNFWALDAVGSYTTPGATDAYWFLVPQGTSRPAFAEVFLSGYRTPLITIKDSGQFNLSGGAVPSREGSFEVDDIEVRGRHVVSAAAIAPTIVVRSNGTGA